MKLFCTSDLHGNLENFEQFDDCEIVIIAGDFSKMYGFGKWHLHNQKKWIERKFIPLTQKHKNKQFMIVPGNHDLCLDPKRTNFYNDLDWNIIWPDNVHVLIDRHVELNGLEIYGTPWIPTINCRWAFEAEHDVLLDHFRKIPSNLDVLITHTPPRIQNCMVDMSLQTVRGPFGSSELTMAIFEKQPKHVICGHIHSGSHECFEFENSKLHNVSRLDENYEIAYEPLILDI